MVTAEQERTHHFGFACRLDVETDGTTLGLPCAPQADTASPAALVTLTAALTSRSKLAPQPPQAHTRTGWGLGPYWTPHREHT